MPVLSVIIPTHNRQRYAVNSILTIIKNFDDIEVIVSDTSDTDSLKYDLHDFIKLGRVIYLYSVEKMDVVKNFERGLHHISGDYVIFLGDDDCLGPNADKVAALAKARNIDAVSCSLPASYGWPDFMSKYFGDGYAAKLAIKEYSGKLERLSGMTELQNCLNNFGAGPLQMPRLYLGMVSKKFLDKIVNKYGKVFGGVSPDIYSAALIAMESAYMFKIDYPFILPGSSGASTSGLSALGKHKSKLRDNPHISAFIDLVWDPLIPEFYSVQTVWSFSLLQALNINKQNHTRPNYARLYVKCLMFHRLYWPETIISIKRYAKKYGLINTMKQITIESCRETFFQIQRTMRRVLRPKSAIVGATVVDNINTIEDAFNELSLFVRTNNVFIN